MSGYCRIAPGHEWHGPYHAEHYGFPIGDDDELFERLILEINQAGQFLFLEDMVPDIGVVRMMASFLAAGACDYPIIDDASLTMARFRSSEAYAALARRLHVEEPSAV